MTISPTCVTLLEDKSIVWKGSLGVKGLFDGEHHFELIIINQNETLFRHFENFSGILIPVLWKSIFPKTLEAFHLLNQQLKNRAESEQN